MKGKHPNDHQAFNPTQHPNLLSAANDLAWLKTKGYADPSSLKLVGDRYSLTARQRTAVARSTCSDTALQQRLAKQITVAEAIDKTIHIDGFNLLLSIEAFLGNGILLIGRDGCLRDMSSMHGNYRLFSNTDAAINLISDYLRSLQAKSIHWLLDKPVSNSGRLKAKLLDLTNHQVELVPDPDLILRDIHSETEVIITADSGILNYSNSGPWLNAAREIFESNRAKQPDLIVVDFSNL